MSTLRDTQRWLLQAIRAPEGLAEDARVEETLAIDDRGAALERLRAHIGGYPARLHEALTEAFPAVRHIVGAEEFRRLAHRYLPHVPTGAYDLADVGVNLPALLRTDGIAQALPFLPDLARLEWCVHRAFHAHAAPPLDAAALAAWPLERWERARVWFQGGVAVVRSPWPVRALWEARKTPRDRIDVALDGRPDRVLVYRVEYRVACESIDDAEADALTALLRGRPLGAVLAESVADPAAAAKWTGSWLARGLLARIDDA